uniref:Zygote arrest 1 n=1 Tax=Eptatretus burgeri TaxID=7764 RepID=A0A8C4PZN5_EPTBU
MEDFACHPCCYFPGKVPWRRRGDARGAVGTWVTPPWASPPWVTAPWITPPWAPPFPGLWRPPLERGKDVGVQVSPKREAGTQCTLGPRTLAQLRKLGVAPWWAANSSSVLPSLPRTLAVYSPLTPRLFPTLSRGMQNANLQQDVERLDSIPPSKENAGKKDDVVKETTKCESQARPSGENKAKEDNSAVDALGDAEKPEDVKMDSAEKPEDVKMDSVEKLDVAEKPEDVKKDSAEKPEDVKKDSVEKLDVAEKPEDVKKDSVEKLDVAEKPEDVKKDSVEKLDVAEKPEDVKKDSAEKPEDVKKDSVEKLDLAEKPEDVKKDSVEKPEDVMKDSVEKLDVVEKLEDLKEKDLLEKYEGIANQLPGEIRFQFLEQKYGFYHCRNCNVRWESAYVWCIAGTNKVYFKQLCRSCQKEYNPYRVEDIVCKACGASRCECEMKRRHVDLRRPHRQELCCRCRGRRLSCDNTFSFNMNGVTSECMAV